MSNLEEAIETLTRRVASLEAENSHLRRRSARPLGSATGTSRRQVLLGGAGILTALAGGTLLGHAEPALAAPAEELAVRPTRTSLRIMLAPVKSRSVFWARHEWQLGPQFSGEPPVVVATAADDYMDVDVTSSPTCGVTVQGKPGAYTAVIMVRNVSQRAGTVEVHAVAFGD
jgi:hypothetical protein